MTALKERNLLSTDREIWVKKTGSSRSEWRHAFFPVKSLHEHGSPQAAGLFFTERLSALIGSIDPEKFLNIDLQFDLVEKL